MSAKKDAFRNVPSPAGAKAATAYTRFIPREELGEVASWRPGTFGARAGGAAQAAQSPAAEPNAAEWHKRVQAARQSGYQDGYRDGLAALENFKQQFATQATAQIGTLLEAFDRQLAALDGSSPIASRKARCNSRAKWCAANWLCARPWSPRWPLRRWAR